MTQGQRPIIVRAELPTAAVVVVQPATGAVLLFADTRIPQLDVDRAVADLATILEGPAHALG